MTDEQLAKIAAATEIDDFDTIPSAVSGSKPLPVMDKKDEEFIKKEQQQQKREFQWKEAAEKGDPIKPDEIKVTPDLDEQDSKDSIEFMIESAFIALSAGSAALAETATKMSEADKNRYFELLRAKKAKELTKAEEIELSQIEDYIVNQNEFVKSSEITIPTKQKKLLVNHIYKRQKARDKEPTFREVIILTLVFALLPYIGNFFLFKVKNKKTFTTVSDGKEE